MAHTYDSYPGGEDGSVGELQNDYASFFGPLPDFDQKLMRADRRLKHESYPLAKQYEGYNAWLTELMAWHIRENGQNDFLLRYVFPWAYSESMTVKWVKWTFDRTLMDIVPSSGLSRIISTENETNTAHMTRRGLAMTLDWEFAQTERGRQIYSMNMKAIQQSIIDTGTAGCLQALLTSKDFYREWRRKFQSGKSTRQGDLWARERRIWGMVAKTADTKSMYVLDALIKHDMNSVGIKPDVLILPPKAGIYISMLPDRETLYTTRGPGAHEELTEDKIELTKWRGSLVYETESIDMDFSGDPVDILTRQRNIGTYYVIPSGYQAIKIYSVDEDDWVTIHRADAAAAAMNQADPEKAKLLEECIATLAQNCFPEALEKYNRAVEKAAKTLKKEHRSKFLKTQFIGDVESNVVTLQDAKKLKGSAKGIVNMSNGKQAVNWQKVDANVSINLLNGAKADGPSGSEVLKSSNGAALKASFEVVAEAHANLRKAIELLSAEPEAAEQGDILIFRPHESYLMASHILVKGGDVGSTFYGHSSFHIATDALTKQFHGNYTYYQASVLKDPRCVALAEDVYPRGYISGAGHEFFNTKDEYVSAVNDAVIGSADNTKSLIAWILPKGAGDKLPRCIDMYGSFPTPLREYDDSSEHYPGASVLRSLLELDSINPYRVRAEEFLERTNHINTVCFRGHCYAQANGAKEFVLKSLNTGHWGCCVGPGSRDIIDGVEMLCDKNKDKEFIVGQSTLQ